MPGGRLQEHAWVNVVDVDHWWLDRRGRDRSGRPVVGRHSRPSPQKWPLGVEREAAYPSDGRWDIRVVGVVGAGRPDTSGRSRRGPVVSTAPPCSREISVEGARDSNAQRRHWRAEGVKGRGS